MTQMNKNNIITRDHIGEVLMEFGILPNKQGFWHIIDAVMICHNDKNCSFTTVLAKQTGKTKAAVERAISGSLKGLDFSDPKVAEFFGKAPHTNSGLIYMLTWRLEIECKN